MADNPQDQVQEAPQGQDQQDNEPAKGRERGGKERGKRKSFEERHAAVLKAKEPEQAQNPEPAKADAPATETAKTEEAKAPPKDGSDLTKRYVMVERRETRAKKRESELSTRASELDKREQTIRAAETRLEARYGDPDAMKQAYARGDFHAFAKMAEKVTGDSFATITQKIARATSNMDPAKLKELEEREKFEREKREFEAEKERQKKAAERTTTREQALKVVADRCAKHEALRLPDGAESILRKMEESWDEHAKGFKITFQQAADSVVKDVLAKAEKLGAKRAAEQIKVTPQKKPDSKPAAPQPEANERTLRGGKKPMSFAERHALAGRLQARRRA